MSSVSIRMTNECYKSALKHAKRMTLDWPGMLIFQTEPIMPSVVSFVILHRLALLMGQAVLSAGDASARIAPPGLWHLHAMAVGPHPHLQLPLQL